MAFISFSRESIQQNVEAYASKWLGPDFAFRPHQKECIVEMLENILCKHIRNNIIQAPTGSGKSLIALIVGGVLSEHYNKKSYILCSDTYLHEQYENAIVSYNLPFGNIKGQHHNYMCNVNGQDANCAQCKLNHISFHKLMNFKWLMKNPQWNCAHSCKWIQDRKKAMKADVTVMTYQFFLFQIHEVNAHAKPENVFFPQRDVVICDECHKIPEIVQNLCSAKFSSQDVETLAAIFKKGQLHSINNEYAEKMLGSKYRSEGREMHAIPEIKPSEFKKMVKKYFEELRSFKEKENALTIDDKRHLIGVLSSFVSDVCRPCEMIEHSWLAEVAIRLEKGEKLTKEEWDMTKLFQWIEQFVCKYDWLLPILEGSSNMKEEGLVRETTERKLSKTLFRDSIFSEKVEEVVTDMCFCSIDESVIISQKFLPNANDSMVMMSATVGDITTYTTNLGIQEEEYDYKQLPSIFDFTNSPINCLLDYKMSYKFKNENLPILANYVEMICNYHSGQHGLIHTGSYEITRRLFDYIKDDNLKKRLKFYDNAQEKKDYISCLSDYKDTIIVGPTMNEGIDLPDDLCRFMVIMKMPYPNLASDYVKAKMKYIETWYTSETVNKLIQTIGRGVRNEKDWCTTYIIDGCFGNLASEVCLQDINIKSRLRLVKP